MRHKKDDRRDNVEKIQNNIDNTTKNYSMTKEAIQHTDNPVTKQQLQDKNERRKESLGNMKREIIDEAMARKNGFQ